MGRRPGGRAALVAWLLFLRFHLAAALLFVALPFVALGPARSLLANLYVLPLAGQLLVAVLALLLGHVVVTTAWTSTRCGPLRLWQGSRRGVRRLELGEFRRAFERSWRARRWDHRLFVAADSWVALALALPTLLVVAWSSRDPDPWCPPGAPWAMARLGAVVAALALVRSARLAVDFLVELLSPEPDPRARSILARGGWMARFAARHRSALAVRIRERIVILAAKWPFGPGYVWEDRRGERHLHSGHVTALALSLVSLAVYGLLGWLEWPGTRDPWLPTLGSVLLVLTVAVWILPGLSFLLDRWRVPVVPSLLVLSLLLFKIAGSDHFFTLVPAAGPTADVAVPASADEDLDRLDGWLAPSAPPLVVVAAEGGGITSAAWTATALAGLASGSGGGDFLRSLRLISAVSGGSVGTMFFVDRLPDPDDDGTGASSERWAREVGSVAARSSLDSVGWALAYPDLQRLLFSFPWATLRPEVDRSWALAESWKRRLVEPETPTLGRWRQLALAGRVPLVMFNTTTVETGERIVFSNLAVGDSERTTSFWAAYPGWDVDVPTAVRLSSTFPFVGLAARARAPSCAARLPKVGSAAHFVDGGYADNSGIVSALELLDKLLRRRCADASGACVAPPILVVRLRAFDPESRSVGDIARSSHAWSTAALSPLETLAAVRSASQADRNQLELSLFARRWRQREVKLALFDLELGGLGPLSWKLTAAERRRIDCEWKRQADDPAGEVARLRSALAGDEIRLYSGERLPARRDQRACEPSESGCGPAGSPDALP